ncbi:site-specific integrase [Sesbania bispinosa]|nr:site-specific integrase [Sesbania bispinosa]
MEKVLLFGGGGRREVRRNGRKFSCLVEKGGEKWGEMVCLVRREMDGNEGR